MKKLSFFFVFLLLSPFVVADVYPLPNPGQYNNIGIQAYVLMDLNVTLINRGPFDKFVLVNPAYNYTIMREEGDSLAIIGSVGDSILIDYNLSKNMLNYYLGFWMEPYETVKVNIKAVEAWPVNLTVEDYQNFADIAYSNRSAGYYNKTPVFSALFQSPEESIFYETIYPQIIVYPQKYYTLDKIFKIDAYINVVKFEGKITLVLKNVPNEDGSIFRTYFAVGMPVIFEGAKTYDFTPDYTMMFKEYINDFLPEYFNMKPITQKMDTEQKKPAQKFKMYSLTNTLLVGKTVKNEPPQIKQSSVPSFDYPIWIVWLGGDKVEISYRVKWNNRGKVSPVGGQKEKEIWFILDRRDIR
ncbi:hypothetical protein PAP_00405 [Palaeococcus pacificus DY20341]|uniref:Uncharacterized protein n=1 Tax=Palaeococcus pacificus DY20341 TaxID=1343739 RepID=A0A075LVN4_9EURY|nr:hypothetical protein [Palaeococcus pacificus]AIF68528.1 hypothetical protein PAP_00405 [Palaeococcus pacificus DY20341]